MDTVEYVKAGLAGRTWTELRVIATATGVPTHTIRHIALGNTKDPRHHTLEPLRAYLEAEIKVPA